MLFNSDSITGPLRAKFLARKISYHSTLDGYVERGITETLSPFKGRILKSPAIYGTSFQISSSYYLSFTIAKLGENVEKSENVAVCQAILTPRIVIGEKCLVT